MGRSTDISPLSVLLNRVDAASDGTPASDTVASGFPSIDRMLGGGFRRGDLVILGGDVASGKSALALAFAIRAADERRRVAFLSAEMSTERVLERVLAIEARARIDDLRNGSLDDAARANAGTTAIRLRNRLPIIEQLPNAARTLDETLEELPELDLLVVDSMQALAFGTRETMNEELAVAVRDLKDLALKREMAILTTAPLPFLTTRPDRRPTLDDFGAMGAVKELADVVLALYREDMYDPARDIQGATELLIRKNRNGPIGYVDLYFYSQWMRFEDMLDPDR